MLSDNMLDKSGITIQGYGSKSKNEYSRKIYAESEKRKNVKTPVNQRRGRC